MLTDAAMSSAARREGPTQAARVEDYIDMAFVAAAGSRPGPAALLLPADLLRQSVSPSAKRRSQLGRYPLDRVVADPKNIAEAADFIAAAGNPIVMAGGGIHLSQAQHALAALQERHPDRVLATNVEYYSAIVLDVAEIPPKLAPAMFACSRVAGWSAHILEQKRTGRLFRPSARYVGPPSRSLQTA